MGLTFRPIGNDGHTLFFWTPSWTRPEHEGHELHLELSSCELRCSCEDSVMRQKNGHRPGDPECCKHCRAFSRYCWPVIARAIGAVS